MNTRFLCCIIFTLVTALSIAQNTGRVYNDKQNMEVVLEKEPAFPGGETALFKYFYDSLSYTQEAIELNLSGEVMLSFDVLPDSTISNALIISGLGYGIDEEVIRLIEKLKYAPSIQNGMQVKSNVILTLPLRARKK